MKEDANKKLEKWINESSLYEDVQVRTIKEIQKEIEKQKGIVIGIGDCLNTEYLIANERVKTLEWVLGARSWI